MNHELRWPEDKISIDTFLQEYWQQKPLLIKNAFPNIDPLISPDELAGLACEEGIESRIIVENDDDQHWALKKGPFGEEVFGELPETHWTLLVQDVEKHLPDLACFLAPFRFIPDWRIDDLMISFAPEGGSVGPHTDNYDVFLLQTHGKRHWQISEQTPEQWQHRQDTPLCILSNFEQSESWITEPGDLLYLPPSVPHHGVALEDCMTYSIGFRAPSAKELIDDYALWRVEHIDNQAWFCDAKRSDASAQHNITRDDLTRVRNILQTALETSDTQLAQWFGELVTRNKPDFDAKHVDETFERIPENCFLERNPASRLSWYKDDQGCFLFVDGETFASDKALGGLFQTLCRDTHLQSDNVIAMEQSAQAVVLALINQGHLWPQN